MLSKSILKRLVEAEKKLVAKQQDIVKQKQIDDSIMLLQSYEYLRNKNLFFFSLLKLTTVLPTDQ